MYTLKPSMAELRRRSVDVGGLALALSAAEGAVNGSGAGWRGGWEEDQPVGAEDDEEQVRYAELLSDMYNSTQSTVNYHLLQHLPPVDESPETRKRLIDSLDTWHFEPHKLPENAVLACTILLFEALLRTEGMEEDVGFSVARLTPFLRHLRGIYRQENSYHNFQHALDVLQATHMFLSAAGVVPPVSILAHSDGRKWPPDRTRASPLVACLSNSDLFALYIAAIGHDVGHPGFSNVFMKNAKTPLSAVYNDQSALEQMHCALLLRVMRAHGLGALLDAPSSGHFFRNLLLQTVLATDMSVHFKFMTDFDSQLSATSPSPSPDALQKQKILVCQALIKCADISNPCRPRGVARHWANALMAEWTAQAELERALRLPSTVNPSAEPLAEAKSQVFFIGTFAGPLFNLTAKGIPELSPYAREGASNLEWWSARRDRLIEGNTPGTPPPGLSTSSPSGSKSSDGEEAPIKFTSAFPLTLPPELRVSEPSSPLPPSPIRSAFLNGSTPALVSSPAALDDVPPSPTMPGAFVVTPPTLTRSLSSPPPSPPSPRSNGTWPGRLHIATNLPQPAGAAGPLPTPPPDASPPGLLGSHSHSHTRTNSGASATSAVSAGSALSGTSASGNTAIRTAWKMGLRKKRSQHMHRSSWNPTSVPPVPQHLFVGANISSPIPSTSSSPAPSARSSPVVNIFGSPREDEVRQTPTPSSSGPSMTELVRD